VQHADGIILMTDGIDTYIFFRKRNQEIKQENYLYSPCEIINHSENFEIGFSKL
jgi:hypothetical protein